MEKMDVSKLDSLPFGRGRAGKCYILNDEYLIKQYDILDEFTLRYEEDKVKKFVGLENSTYIYPSEAYFCNGYLNQSKIKFIHGKTLFLKYPDVSVDELMNAIPVVYEDLIAVSDDNIFIGDLHDGNIILTNSKLYLIDRDEDVKDEFDSDFCLRENLYNFNECIYHYILSDNYYLRKATDDLICKSKMLRLVKKELLRHSGQSYLLKDFLYEYKCAVRKRYHRDLDSLRDIRSCLLLDKKRVRRR